MDNTAIVLGIDHILLAREAARMRAIRMSQVPGIPPNSAEGRKETLTLLRRCLDKEFPNCAIRRNTHNVSIRISDMEEYSKYDKLLNAMRRNWVSTNDLTPATVEAMDNMYLPDFACTRDYGSTPDNMRTFIYVDGTRAHQYNLTLHSSLAILRRYKAGLIACAQDYDRLEQVIEQRRQEYEERQRRIEEIQSRAYNARNEYNRAVNSEISEINSRIRTLNNTLAETEREASRMMDEVAPFVQAPLRSIQELQQLEQQQSQMPDTQSSGTNSPDTQQTPGTSDFSATAREIQEQLSRQHQQLVDELMEQLTRGA